MTDESSPTDVSLLELVRQYGDVRFETGALLDGGDRGAFMASRGLAETLFDRIAALVAQQPVQARDEHGMPWWIHGCGEAGVAVTLAGLPEMCCDRGPWRPLLVGGDPAPIRSEEAQKLAASEETVAAMVETIAGLCRMFGAETGDEALIVAAARNDLMAQVMAELGVDRPEDVLSTLKRWSNERTYFKAQWDGAEEIAKELRGKLHDARAEVERQAAGFLAAVNKLTMEREFARRERDEAMTERDDYAYRLGEAHADLDALKAAQPDPLVLSLPEVPEGAVALVGVSSGARYSRTLDGFWLHQDEDYEDDGLPLLEVLEREGSARVEMAPPREPRTWPKLDGAPKDLAKVDVKGHGRFVVAVRRELGSTTFVREDEAGIPMYGVTHTLSDLRELGDVTEVLDEPDGAA